MTAEHNPKMFQLDAFRSQQECADQEFKKRVDKSIKGLFARYNELEYAFLNMHDTLERLIQELHSK